MRKQRQHSRQNARWNGWWVALCVVLLGGSGITYWYVNTDRTNHWPIKQIRIQGSFVYLDKAALRQQVAAMIDGGFFSLDMVAVRNRLLEHPWIVDAGVRRLWPDTLRVHVTEQRPIARWQQPDGASADQTGLLNQQGEVFRPHNMPTLPDLPLLQGNPDQATRMVHFYRLIRTHAAQNALRIAQLHLDARNAWHVHFAGGLHLLLGQTEQAQRWRDFMRIYAKLKNYGEPQRVDMRYAHGVAVRWRDAAGAESVAQTQTPLKQQEGEG